MSAILDALDAATNAVLVDDAGAKGDGVTDDSGVINAILAEGKNAALGVGRYLIKRPLVMRGRSQLLIGIDRRQSTLVVDHAFPMHAPGVVVLENHAPEVREIGFEFKQEPSVSQRARLQPFPPAIHGYNVTRGRFEGLIISSAYDGIHLLGNCGGAILRDIENGSLNIGIHIDGALAGCELSNCRIWPFGFAHLRETGIGAIYRDGQTIGYKIGKADAFSMVGCLAFRARTVLGDFGRGGPFGTIVNPNTDGPESRIEMDAGNVAISNLYGSIRDVGIDDPFEIRQTGGNLALSNLMIRSNGAMHGALVQVDGEDAKMSVNGGHMLLGWAPYLSGFRVSKGFMSIRNMNFEMMTDGRRGAPVIEQVGGRLVAIGNSSMLPAGKGVGWFVRVDKDEDALGRPYNHYIKANDPNGWSMRKSAG